MRSPRAYCDGAFGNGAVLAGPLWQVANPPKKLADAYAEAKATDLPPDWNIDFTSALTRLITATCVGLMAEPAESNPG
jgi:hypothetical protein